MEFAKLSTGTRKASTDLKERLTIVVLEKKSPYDLANAHPICRGYS